MNMSLLFFLSTILAVDFSLAQTTPPSPPPPRPPPVPPPPTSPDLPLQESITQLTTPQNMATNQGSAGGNVSTFGLTQRVSTPNTNGSCVAFDYLSGTRTSYVKWPLVLTVPYSACVMSRYFSLADTGGRVVQGTYNYILGQFAAYTGVALTPTDGWVTPIESSAARDAWVVTCISVPVKPGAIWAHLFLVLARSFWTVKLTFPEQQ